MINFRLLYGGATDSRVFLPGRPDMEDVKCFQLQSRGHPSRREANWERRESSVSDSVALETVTCQTPQPAWLSDHGRRAALSRQDAVSSGSSNTDSTPRLQSPAGDGCSSPPWLLSPGVGATPALSPLWTGSGLPPPPSWTVRSPAALRPLYAVKRSVSSASSRVARGDYAGWSDDKLPAGTRHTANSQPSVSTQRHHAFRPRVQRPGDWIMHHARIKTKVRPQQLPGLAGHEVDAVVGGRRRAATTSDNSLSSSDSGGGRYLARSRDKQVPVAMTTAECRSQSQLLSVDSADEVLHVSADNYPHLRIAQSPHISTEPVRPADTADVGNDRNLTVQSLIVPTGAAGRRSVSLGRTSSAFSRAFDEDDAQ